MTGRCDVPPRRRAGPRVEAVSVEWRAQAACRREDPELFFPPGRDDVDSEQIAAAKAICASCEVVDACLAFALEHGIRDGIWGGLTDRERQALRRSRRGRRVDGYPR